MDALTVFGVVAVLVGIVVAAFWMHGYAEDKYGYSPFNLAIGAGIPVHAQGH